MCIFTGPVMLLELCDTTLKDWLYDNSTADLDVLEDIMIFALNVARAVQFLHSQKVTCAFAACYANLLIIYYYYYYYYALACC